MKAEAEQVIGEKKACCQHPPNLKWIQVEKDIWCGVCRICSCKHWEAVAEPLHMGMRSF